MRNKVKRGRDAAMVGRQRKRGEPAWRYLEGGVPVVVCERRQAKRQLADDLRPHMEGGVGVPPLLERQGRPELAEGRGTHPPPPIWVQGAGQLGRGFDPKS